MEAAPNEAVLRARIDVRAVYARLLRAYGPSGWWPAPTPFEVCVGAILTQNTAWVNVEHALGELRARGLLEPQALARLCAAEIAPLIRASGTYTVKARRLRAFLDFLQSEFDGRLEKMAHCDPGQLRRALLGVHGIGPETADCIVLYAAGLPIFVVDAYTRRIAARLGLTAPTATYDELQRFFTRRLARDAVLFGDYHAQLVRLAKEACRVKPRCALCPLDDLCPKRGFVRGARARPPC